MEFASNLSEEALLRELGQRMEALRLARNLTQAQLAKEAGVSQRTIERLESGSAAAQLTVFLRICRALEIVERLELLLPPPEPGPIELLKRRKSGRKRARRAKDSGNAPWSWGDEH